MKLFLDSTDINRVHIALKKGSQKTQKTFLLRKKQRPVALDLLARFLAAQKVSPQQLRTIEVVTGPGRFSSLRVAAVLANILAWTNHASLVVRQKRFQNGQPSTKLSPSAKVRVVSPYYGKPPSISVRKTKKVGGSP